MAASQFKLLMLADKQKQLSKPLLNSRMSEPNSAKRSPRMLVRRPEPKANEDHAKFTITPTTGSPYQSLRTQRTTTFQNRVMYSSTYIPSRKYNNPEQEGFAKRVQDLKQPTPNRQPSRQTTRLIMENKQLKESVEGLRAENVALSKKVQTLLLQNLILRQNAQKQQKKLKSQLENVKLEAVYNKQLISHFEGMIVDLNSSIQQLTPNKQESQQLQRIQQQGESYYLSWMVEAERNRSILIENTMLRRKQVIVQGNEQAKKENEELSKKNKRLKRENRQLKNHLQKYLSEEFELSPEKQGR